LIVTELVLPAAGSLAVTSVISAELTFMPSTSGEPLNLTDTSSPPWRSGVTSVKHPENPPPGAGVASWFHSMKPVASTTPVAVPTVWPARETVTVAVWPAWAA
jgi:hypothetical protein